MNKRKTIRVFEAFAGYGGASYGLKRSGIKYKVVGFSEIEPSANRILHENFPEINNKIHFITSFQKRKHQPMLMLSINTVHQKRNRFHSDFHLSVFFLYPF